MKKSLKFPFLQIDPKTKFKVRSFLRYEHPAYSTDDGYSEPLKAYKDTSSILTRNMVHIGTWILP